MGEIAKKPRPRKQAGWFTRTLRAVKRRLPATAAHWWSIALGFMGLTLILVMEAQSGALQLSTSADQFDAAGKLAFNCALAVITFGGTIIIASKLAAESKNARKGLSLAILAVVVSFGIVAANNAGYRAFKRTALASEAATSTEQYQTAKAEYVSLSARTKAVAGEVGSTSYNNLTGELADAGRVLNEGRAPIGVVWFVNEDELKPGEALVRADDIFFSAAGLFLSVVMGTAFRLPQPQRKRRKAKAAGKAKPVSEPAQDDETNVAPLRKQG